MKGLKIDDLMYINDGIMPFKVDYLSANGLGYKPYLPNIIGGSIYEEYDNYITNFNNLNMDELVDLSTLATQLNMENKIDDIGLENIEDMIRDRQAKLQGLNGSYSFTLRKDNNDIYHDNNDNNNELYNDMYNHNFVDDLDNIDHLIKVIERKEYKTPEEKEMLKRLFIKKNRLLKLLGRNKMKGKGKMIGGMTKINPLLKNELTFEIPTYYNENDENEENEENKEEIEMNYNVDFNTFKDFIESNINNDKFNIKKIIKENLHDVEEIIVNDLYPKNSKKEFKKSINDIDNILSQLKNIDNIDEDTKNYINELEQKNNEKKYNNVLYNVSETSNELFDMMNKRANKEYEKSDKSIEPYLIRGDKAEDYTIKYDELTNIFDNNNNVLISSKDDDFYNNEYVKYMKDFYKTNANNVYDIIKDYDTLKKKFIIDAVKYGDNPILWELKSHKTYDLYNGSKFLGTVLKPKENERFTWSIFYDTNNGPKILEEINHDDIIYGIKKITFKHVLVDEKGRKVLKSIDNVLKNDKTLRYGILDISGKGNKVLNVIDKVKNLKDDILLSRGNDKITLSKNDFTYVPSRYSNKLINTIKDMKNKGIKKTTKKKVKSNYNKSLLK